MKEYLQVADRGRACDTAAQAELTAVTSLSPFALSYQTIPSTYNINDAKDKLQDWRHPIQPTQGMRITQHILVARGVLMSFQHSPYPPLSVSGGPGVLTRLQRRQQLEAEGPPHPHESLIANPTTSAGNEGSSAVVEKV